MGYRIKTVAEMVGVPRNTLLAWERRYGLVTPSRRPNGYREYTADDVGRLRELKALIDAGHRVGEAVTLIQERESTRQQDQGQRPVRGALPGDLDALVEDLAAALLRYDRVAADRLVATLEGRPYLERIRRVYFPLLRQTGTGWADGEVSVAQEHFVSGFCHERMMAMLMSLGSGPPDGPVALCAGFPEDRHDLGLLGVAIQLALGGWRVAWLGADLPWTDLCETTRREAPAMVCVAVLMPQPPALLGGRARELRAVSPAGTRVVFGGAGLPEEGLPDLPGVEWVHRARNLNA